MRALKRLAGYLKGTRDLGVKMAKPTTPQDIVDLVAWPDSDWAGDAKGRKSQASARIAARGCPVLGFSCRQDAQPLSSCEAEGHAGARCVSEGLGLEALFTFMGYS
eukprot:3931314-Pyramimonas_sp.AAC.1